MAQTNLERLKELIPLLNRYCDEYYNQNAPTISDVEYDRLYNELIGLQTRTNVYMADSPTMRPGYPPVSGLKKTNHPIPLLSLDKVKAVSDLITFQQQKQLMLMLKLDGLTVKLTYENCQLMEASTRGDGVVGEIIHHNVCSIAGIPIMINHKKRLVVTGEAFISPSDFEDLKTKVFDNDGNPYKNARNLAAGSVRQLDPAKCRERRVRFQAFNVLEGFEHLPNKSQRLRQLPALGFDVCKFFTTSRPLGEAQMESGIQQLRDYAKENDIPIDGIVVTYNDAAFSKSCGRTGHHYKDGLAFKFEDEMYETVLQEIEWNPSRFGEITPVAIFAPVIIDGCEVSRATLSNLSIIEGLELMPGCRILVSKRNMIIPHVEGNLDRGRYDKETVIPAVCPCCGEPTRIHESEPDKDGRIVKTLHCDNPECDTRHLRKFVHFVSDKAMDIEQLGEETLEKLIGRGWLHTYTDIYELDSHRREIIAMDGFGEKKWQRIWDAIQKSRDTTFERFLVSMDIPMIGRTASKALAKQFGNSLDAFEEAVAEGFDFSHLEDFGEVKHQNIYNWFWNEENYCMWFEMKALVSIRSAPATAPAITKNPFTDKTIVVTGKVEPYTREQIHSFIESLGARAGSSVSSKTNYLVCGEKAGSKLDKARSLGVTVLTPDQFFDIANGMSQSVGQSKSIPSTADQFSLFSTTQDAA